MLKSLRRGHLVKKKSAFQGNPVPRREKSLHPLPEIVLSTRATSYRVSRDASAGRLKKIAPRLYTTRVMEPPERVIRRNLWDVVGLLSPGAVISQRTALELKPTSDGSVFITGRYNRTLKLPGVTLRMVPGPGPLEGDARYGEKLWIASQARAYLENLKPTRRRSGAGRALSQEEIEDRLERMLRVSGEKALNDLRDAAQRVAPALKLTKELAKLQDLIGKLLGSRAGGLSGSVARARLAGLPYDADRLPVFDSLVAELRSWPAVDRPRVGVKEGAFDIEAFFDAYFSNYIEGTEFEVDEAVGIVFEHRIPAQRPKDAHDILGTYRLLSDLREMSHSAVTEVDDLEGFLDLLRRRHRTMLADRPEVGPGEFKTKPNRAGNTEFVAPELVRGTLQKGLQRFRALDAPFARAAFMMFLVAEVHPFTDGNGRIARVMMNAELIAGGQRRIIVPTVYKDDYLGALRALTRSRRTDVLPKMLDRAQLFTSRIDFSDLAAARRALDEAQAFREPREGRLRIPE
jgi:fido (protein-threonine AMPylation protein)